MTSAPPSPPPRTPPKRSLLRAGVVVPAILAVLLIAAITVAVMEFRRADRPEAPTTTAKPPTATSPTFTPLPPPPEPVQPPTTSRRLHPYHRRSHARRGDRRQLFSGRQHGHDGRRDHRVLLDAADDAAPSIWSLNLGRCPEPDGHDRADRGAAADRGRVAGAGVHAADRPDRLRCREDDPTQ